MCGFWYFEVVGENEKVRLVSEREREREREREMGLRNC